MRMWMVNPRYMCRQHLLGEHLEIHMFAGAMNKNKNLNGFARNGLLEPYSLHGRHDNLVKEMERRGYTHKTPMPVVNLSSLDSDLRNSKVDMIRSEHDLFGRCQECKKRFLKGGE